MVEGHTAASYSVCKYSFSPSITTPPRFFIFILCLRFPFPLLVLIHICRFGQAIKISDQVIKSSSSYQVTSGSRFDRQEFCGSGVKSSVEMLAPRVDLHGTTSLSSRQRVCFSSFLSLSPSLCPPLSVSPLCLSSPLTPSSFLMFIIRSLIFRFLNLQPRTQALW